MLKDVCPICRNKLFPGYRSWHQFCRECGYEKSNFKPTMNSYSSHQTIDENARETGLIDLRKRNFSVLIKKITALKATGGRLLEVGCAHGWFLSEAKKNFEVLGIEPDKKFLDATASHGSHVRIGYFPNALEERDKFDVIVFNDVFEHIPDIFEVLECCHKRLNKDGLLVINLPNNKGFFYKLSKTLCWLNIFSFFERMWQKDFPSPHLHYFNIANIKKLLKDNKFKIEIDGNLPTLRLNGLFKRIAHTGNYNTTICFLIYITIALLFPILKILPNDIVYIIVKRL